MATDQLYTEALEEIASLQRALGDARTKKTQAGFWLGKLWEFVSVETDVGMLEAANALREILRAIGASTEEIDGLVAKCKPPRRLG